MDKETQGNWLLAKVHPEQHLSNLSLVTVDGRCQDLNFTTRCAVYVCAAVVTVTLNMCVFGLFLVFS